MDNSFMKAQVTEGVCYWEDNFEMCVALRAIYIKREDLTHDGTPPPPPNCKFRLANHGRAQRSYQEKRKDTECQ